MRVPPEQPIRLSWRQMDSDLVRAHRRVQSARAELAEAEAELRTLIRMIHDPLFTVVDDPGPYVGGDLDLHATLGCF